MRPASKNKKDKKQNNPPEIDILSLNGNECYYDLDTFVKIVTVRQGERKAPADSSAGRKETEKP